MTVKNELLPLSLHTTGQMGIYVFVTSGNVTRTFRQFLRGSLAKLLFSYGRTGVWGLVVWATHMETATLTCCRFDSSIDKEKIPLERRSD